MMPVLSADVEKRCVDEALFARPEAQEDPAPVLSVTVASAGEGQAGVTCQLHDLSEAALLLMSAMPWPVGTSLDLVLEDDVAQRRLAFTAVVSAVQAQPAHAASALHCVPGPDSRASQWPRDVRNLAQRLRVDRAITRASRLPNERPVCQPADQMQPASVHFAQARSIEDREAAYRLVYDAYFRKGLADPVATGLYTNAFLRNPQTVTFVGKVSNEVAMTVTSIPDSEQRLPMDAVFEDCLAPLREQGRTLVEFGMLAVSSAYFGGMNYSVHDPQRMLCVYSLFRIALQHARFSNGYTDVVFAVPPKHQALYRFMGVNAISEVRYYSKYNTPAVAIRIDLVALRLRPHVREFLFATPLAELSEIGHTEWSPPALQRIFGSAHEACAPLQAASYCNSET